MVSYKTKKLIKEYEENEKARVERDIDYRKVHEAIKELKSENIGKLDEKYHEEVLLLRSVKLIPKTVNESYKLNDKQIAKIIDYRLEKGQYKLPHPMDTTYIRDLAHSLKRPLRGISQGAPTLAYYLRHPVNGVKKLFGYKPTALERAGEGYDRLQGIAKKAKGKLPKDIDKNIENINKYTLYKDIIEEMHKDRLVGKYRFTSLEHALDRKVKKEGKDITDKIREDIISAILILAGAFFISMSREGMYFTGNIVKENFVAMNGLGIGVILLIAALVVLFVNVLLRKH